MYYLQTARYLSVARLIVRNVVQDINMFFSGYLNINIQKSLLSDICSPDVRKEPGIEDQLDVEDLDHAVVPDTFHSFN